MLPDKPSYEVVDAIELAQRWRVPVSWIREQTRDRASDPLPCVRLGRYVRFEPEVSRVVGEAQKLSDSFLTSLPLSEIIPRHGDKKEPKRCSSGKVGRGRSGQFPDQGGTLSHCQESSRGKERKTDCC